MKRFYDSRRWRKSAKSYLAEHPFCALCERQGRDTLAVLVDHINPHEENYDLFWDRDNWQGLCASCHSGIKRLADNHGYSPACGVDGLPLDTNHPYNRLTRR